MAEDEKTGATGGVTGAVGVGPSLTPTGQELVPTFANQVHIIVSPEVVRITFGEALLGVEGIRFDTAIVVPLSLARGMADLILRMAATQQAELVKSGGQHGSAS